MKEIWLPSPHYSTSRGPYNKIVLHTTEGAMKIRDLGAWFQNPSAKCSSHHGADNYERGVFGAYVYENHKAWTQGGANDYCLSLEMCAYASWSKDIWLNSKNVLLDNAAEWVRYCVDKYNIPWTVLSDSQAQNPNVRGICQHVNLGSWGSGHHDCGSGFPMDEVIKRAKGGSTTAETGGQFMPAIAFDDDGGRHSACIWQDGKVNYKFGNNAYQAVDDDSYAISGCDIAVNPVTGGPVITYTNRDHDVCTYERMRDGEWHWDNLGGNAK